ncbi:MAG: hypothetical protein HKN87_01025 [Saprospiraceae bacterium]|nr:hypothetical protein [Saprospiraceae bacterium]
MISDNVVARLNYAYNTLWEEIGSYTTQQLDLQILIAEKVADHHGDEFNGSKVIQDELIMLDSMTIINLLNSVHTDGSLRSLLVRNLAAIKIKRFNLFRRVIPELDRIRNHTQ